MDSFLIQAALYLLAAVVAVPLARRMGLGSVLGYLIAGVVIGPALGLVGSETQSLQHFAEFGVVMMLFVIGLEMEPQTLWAMRHRLLGLGGLQIGLTAALIAAAAAALGLSWGAALAVGLTFSLSSTAIVLQTLTEKRLLGSDGGRAAFSVLLTQDIAVIPMLALVPLLAPFGAGPGRAEAEAMSLVDGLPGWGVTLVTLAAVGAVILAGHFLTRPLFRFVAAARLREMFTAVALLIVTGIAVLMILVGLSPALGTFLAGVVLANSEFRHELQSDIEPFKGLLLGLFFITVGAGIDFGVLGADPLGILGLTLGLMAAKFAVLFALARPFGLGQRDRWLFALSLAQAGEFSLVLIGFMVQTYVVPVGLSQKLLLVVALSMLLTPLLFLLSDRVARRLGDGRAQPSPDPIAQDGPIIIAGIGRFGQVVHRMVSASGFRTTVLDHDLETVELMRRFGFKGFFGDPTRPELLHAAGLPNAAVLVVALDDRDAAVRMVEHARRTRPDLRIVARAYDRVHSYRLFRAGADDIVRETFDSSLRAGRYVLQRMGIPEDEAHQRTRAFYRMDRHILRELAELWDPAIPISQNEAYVRRARALNAELETALLSQFARPAAAEDDTIRDEVDAAAPSDPTVAPR
jgi:CPA2 family monovalent cation:H+ antiporter-2